MLVKTTGNMTKHQDKHVNYNNHFIKGNYSHLQFHRLNLKGHVLFPVCSQVGPHIQYKYSMISFSLFLCM